MNVEVFKRFVALQRRKRQLQAELTEVESGVKAAEALVLTELAAAGVPKIEVEHEGTHATVYSSMTAWAKMKEGTSKEQVIAALKSCPDTAPLVSEGYNSQSLSAWMRERLGELRQPLPPEIDAVLELSEVARAGMRETAREKSMSARAMSASGSNTNP